MCCMQFAAARRIYIKFFAVADVFDEQVRSQLAEFAASILTAENAMLALKSSGEAPGCSQLTPPNDS